MECRRLSCLEAKDALRMTMEDPEISFFLIKHFSQPEKSPAIVTRTTLKQEKTGSLWVVEIQERCRTQNTMTAVIALIDRLDGAIVEKQCLNSLLFDEYTRYIRPKFFSSGITVPF